MCVCVCVCARSCSLTYPACKAHAPYHIVICGLRLHHIFSHYLINGTIFGKKVTEHAICVLIFSTNLSETIHILRILQGPVINVKKSSSTRYSYQILVKLEFSGQIFERKKA